MAGRLTWKLFSLLLPLLPLLLLGLLSGSHSAQADDEQSKVRVTPDHVEIGLLYGGRNIHVESEIPSGYEAVILVTGAREHLEFKKKGRKFGLIWMNESELRYKDVPSLYIVESSRKLSELAPPKTLDKLKIGWDSLRPEVCENPDKESQTLFDDLVKIKKKENLFSTQEGCLQLAGNGSGKQKLSGDFFLPAKTPVGEYSIELFGFAGGKGIHLASSTLRLVRSPVVSFIISVARNHGLLYGCLAVVFALLAGFSIGFLFGLGKGEAH